MLDEDALAMIGSVHKHKLSPADRLAIYALGRKGVPVQIIADAYNVKINAIYYITSYERTAAHAIAKRGFDRAGAEAALALVPEERMQFINEAIKRQVERKQHDRRRSRNSRRSPRPRRAGATLELPEAASDATNGGDRSA